MRNFLLNIFVSAFFIRSNCFDGSTNAKFTIVLDAGSTGSRVYIYKFEADRPLSTISEVAHMRVNPALSTFVGNPNGLEKQLGTLIDFAKRHVQPPVKWPITSISLKATAGLRALPVEDQRYLVQEVARCLSVSGFYFDPAATGVISGAEEALYDVLAVNAAFYPHISTNNDAFEFLELTNSSVDAHFIALAAGDMGGSSQQIAFSVPLQLPSVDNNENNSDMKRVMTVEVDPFGEVSFTGQGAVAMPTCQPDWYVSLPVRITKATGTISGTSDNTGKGDSLSATTSVVASTADGGQTVMVRESDRETIAIYAKSLDFMGLIAAMDLVLDSFYNDHSNHNHDHGHRQSDMYARDRKTGEKMKNTATATGTATADNGDSSIGDDDDGQGQGLRHPCLALGSFANIPDFSGPQPLQGAGDFHRCHELVREVLVPYAQRNVNLDCIRKMRPKVRENVCSNTNRGVDIV